MSTDKANKILSENSIYKSGMGSIISTVKANQCIITAFNEGVDICISELEKSGNESVVDILKKYKLEI